MTLFLTSDFSYFYEGWQVTEEVREEVSTNSYVYGLYIDEALAMQNNGSNYYYHADDLYNVVAMTGTNGDVVERYDYDDYGQPTIQYLQPQADPSVAEASSIQNPYLFTGRRYDEKTRLYYYRARYLDSRPGLFTIRDPLEYIYRWDESL
ncbi:MAG: hypothetical protein GKR87_01805 [Kiritimatiellae bacterium]|nr:hypothetical protein [Kiritimatiellia bacterium]